MVIPSEAKWREGMENVFEPMVKVRGHLFIQVCVSHWWTDEHILVFAEIMESREAVGGWSPRKEGNSLLEGGSERQPCPDRPGFVHMALDT